MKRIVLLISICTLVACNCKNKECKENGATSDSTKKTLIADSIIVANDSVKKAPTEATSCKIGDKNCVAK